MRILNSIFNILRFNRKNWKAVVLCIFTATIFWFFNALNKTYTTNINFALDFQYDRQHFIPVQGLPQFVRLNVTGNGWELFKRSTGVKMEPLEIPLERPADTKKIVGNGLNYALSNQLTGLQINHVLSDTLYLDIEPRVGRWIKLAIDSIEHNLKEGYGLASEIAVMPDSTYAEGPRRIINKIKEPVILNIPQRNLDEQFIENIPVEVPFSNLIALQPPTVSVMFNVEEMVTIQDSVSLALEHIPEGVADVMKSGKVPVTFKVPEGFVEGMKRDSIKAVLDLTGFKGGTAKILPRLEGLPPYSSIVKIDSVIVKL
ncbi:MAG TPA: hypothetical protein VFI14_04635 [Chryseosolibacter sp.]|nr:hypothetical protein [Chryseosolibacter sp.]